ncbi:hypothetical protein [Algoriphagus confluentis]|uniref:DUF4249 family protein n=1 Tax=Algoriphagus confluentis TaxID=1697556 RepID=A0ABQ6PQH1_9BACT|nr:hypothetical protein Aconfl_24300 [Algoriphagus confluentis]
MKYFFLVLLSLVFFFSCIDTEKQVVDVDKVSENFSPEIEDFFILNLIDSVGFEPHPIIDPINVRVLGDCVNLPQKEYAVRTRFSALIVSEKNDTLKVHNLKFGLNKLILKNGNYQVLVSNEFLEKPPLFSSTVIPFGIGDIKKNLDTIPVIIRNPYSLIMMEEGISADFFKDFELTWIVEGKFKGVFVHHRKSSFESDFPSLGKIELKENLSYFLFTCENYTDSVFWVSKPLNLTRILN